MIILWFAIITLTFYFLIGALLKIINSLTCGLMDLFPSKTCKRKKKENKAGLSAVLGIIIYLKAAAVVSLLLHSELFHIPQRLMRTVRGPVVVILTN